jgi:hypothetical protein
MEQAQIQRHQRDAAAAEQRHVANALKQVAAEFKAGSGIDDNDTLITGYIMARAMENPKFAAAADARGIDGATWQRELAAARADYSKLSRSHDTLRADTEAARAAVRNVGLEALSQPTLDGKVVERMSDSEWAQVMKDASNGAYDSRRSNVWSGGRGSTPRRR